MSDRQMVSIDPPLVDGEIAFLAAFVRESGLRRVWPGQPSRRCPWRPNADGAALELIEERAQDDPDSVASWLRFFSREFLAPSTAASLDAALAEGLRGGHRLRGEVMVGSLRRVTVDLGRVTEEVLTPPEPDAVVLDLNSRRPQPHDR